MRARSLIVSAAGLLVALECISSCSSTPPPDPCTSVPVDDFKELMIVDPSVVDDARAKNATDGPWSFRHVVESIAPQGMDAGDFVRKWFLEWVTSTTFNGYPLYSGDETPTSRLTSMNQLVLCPWMQRTAGNNCNADCSKCDQDPPKLDLAVAPFRTMGIVNRMDLRGQPDLGASGESRIMFALASGSGDDDITTSIPMPMTMIFEFGLPTSKSAQQWGQEWHALGAFSAFDDTYKTALANFTEEWIGRGSAPDKQNGSALSQVRTNESALFWIWQERQFELGADGNLHVAGLRDTPPDSLNESQVIANYITSNSTEVLAQDYAMPSALLGGAASAALFRWDFPGVTEPQRHAFSGNTCSGCHTQEESHLDTAFHVSPFRTGIDRLSTYVYIPPPGNRLTGESNGGPDQLTVREQNLRDALCGN
jgi:hypothetical protein